MSTVILLANGYGTRFKSNFKDIPKPLIKYKNEPLISWSLKALKTILPNSWDNLIVASRYDSVRNFITKEFSLKVFDPGVTNSPAETILKSINLWQESQILYTLPSLNPDPTVVNTLPFFHLCIAPGEGGDLRPYVRLSD